MFICYTRCFSRIFLNLFIIFDDSCVFTLQVLLQRLPGKNFHSLHGFRRKLQTEKKFKFKKKEIKIPWIKVKMASNEEWNHFSS